MNNALEAESPINLYLKLKQLEFAVKCMLEHVNPLAAASFLECGKGELLVIKALLGHQDIRPTLEYAKANTTQMHKAVQILAGIIEPPEKKVLLLKDFETSYGPIADLAA